MLYFISLLHLYVFGLLAISCNQASSQHCSKVASRVVRKVLDTYVYPVLEYRGIDMSLDCPLRKSRDLYLVQENQKVFEHNARWSCEICGKAFYTQEYIDRHMERKHNDLLIKKEDSPICLADYCQLFRCEALEDSRRNHFWSKALCNKENMDNLKRTCLSLMQSCLPELETNIAMKQAYDEIVQETCSLINCKDYWQPLYYELSSLEVLYYIVVTPFLISILFMYYHSAWEYYYGERSEEYHYETDRRKSFTDHTEQLPGLRNRFNASRFDY